MTVVHVINYTFPIAFMLFFGFLMDRMCKPKPEPAKKEVNE